MPPFEEDLEKSIVEYVIRDAPLAVYDPLHSNRPRVQVVSFNIEFLEVEDGFAQAAGPVTLRTAVGDVENHLRVSVPISSDGQITDPEGIRIAYIVETNPETGACKETIAMANC